MVRQTEDFGTRLFRARGCPIGGPVVNHENGGMGHNAMYRSDDIGNGSLLVEGGYNDQQRR